MPSIRNMTAQYIVAKLSTLGFVCTHQKGSHKQFKKGSLRVTIPIHSGKSLHIKTVLSILQQAQLTKQDLEQ